MHVLLSKYPDKILKFHELCEKFSKLSHCKENFRVISSKFLKISNHM